MGAAIGGPGADEWLERAQAHARRNRSELLAGDRCGCYHCLRTFGPEALGEDDWCRERDGEPTALCPYCGIDAVIGSRCGMPLTDDLLARLRGIWFA